jgi:hypothetical protein
MVSDDMSVLRGWLEHPLSNGGMQNICEPVLEGVVLGNQGKGSITAMSFQANMSDRPPWDMVNDQDLQNRAAGSTNVVGTFLASGQAFEIVRAGAESLDTMSHRDSNDETAIQSGYTILNTLIARDQTSKSALAILEFYAKANGTELLEKGIAVDCNHYRRGIASGFWSALHAQGHHVGLSGIQSTAGEGLIKRLRALGKV